MSEAENLSLVNKYVEACNRHDVDAMTDLYAPGCVFHSSPPWPDAIGPDKKYAMDLFTAFPDARFTVEQVVASGDTVVYRGFMEATHNGPLASPPIPATGKHVVLALCRFDRIANGLVAEEWQFSSDAALLVQLGYLPVA